MDNSNTTASINTSKSTTTPKFVPAANQTTFDIGDVVLCPSLSSFPFTLTADPYGKRDELTLTFEGSYFYYDANGYFIRSGDDETGDFQPSLYHNTPANQQAINTLYGNTSTTQSSQRQIIDITEADDHEVILIPSIELSDTACDIGGAIAVLDDIGSLLWMIYQEEITPQQAISMARLSHDATERWVELLNSRLNTINTPLAQSTFGIEVAS